MSSSNKYSFISITIVRNSSQFNIDLLHNCNIRPGVPIPSLYHFYFIYQRQEWSSSPNFSPTHFTSDSNSYTCSSIEICLPNNFAIYKPIFVNCLLSLAITSTFILQHFSTTNSWHRQHQHIRTKNTSIPFHISYLPFFFG